MTARVTHQIRALVVCDRPESGWREAVVPVYSVELRTPADHAERHAPRRMEVTR